MELRYDVAYITARYRETPWFITFFFYFAIYRVPDMDYWQL